MSSETEPGWGKPSRQADEVEQIGGRGWHWVAQGLELTVAVAERKRALGEQACGRVLGWDGMGLGLCSWEQRTGHSWLSGEGLGEETQQGRMGKEMGGRIY